MIKYNNVDYSGKRIQRRIMAACLVFALLTLLTPYRIFASDNPKQGDSERTVARGAYEVTDFDYEAEVMEDHSYDIHARLTIRIPEPDTYKSIDFAIPRGNFRIVGTDIRDTSFSMTESADSNRITITDSAQLTPGVHSFDISFRILEFADRDESRDILYMPVLIPEWQQPILRASMKVTFPQDFPMDSIKIFAGMLGVQDTTGLLTSDIDNAGHSISITGSKIPENFGLQLKAELPDGYWKGAIDGIWAVQAMILIAIIAVLLLFIMWLIGGRDPKIMKTRETKPVEGISPADFGYIFNNEFGIRDVVSLILYFGTRGYLKISEYEPRRYRLIRVKDPAGEQKHIRTAYGILFEDVYPGRSIDLEDTGDRLRRMAESLEDDIAAGFASREMLAATPLSKNLRIAGIILIAAAAGIVNALKYSYQYVAINYAESVILAAAFGILAALACILDDRRYYSSRENNSIGQGLCYALILGAVIYLSVSVVRQTGSYPAGILIGSLLPVGVFLTVIMRARGAGNAALVMKLRELRRFIYHPTPKELLDNHLSDSLYYYDMLIYALSIGAEESWAISFITLNVQPPDWFSDDVEGQAFSNIKTEPTTIDYARDLRSFVSTVVSGYQAMNRHRRAH